MISARTSIQFAFLLLLLSMSSLLLAQSRWAHLGADGKLVYARSPKGDRIPDFSSAGYRGGGLALPGVRAQRTVSPSGNDDTAAIQKAIDEVSAMPLQSGLRGAVQLASGTFHCAQTISITSSGVVLRGAGLGKNGATIVMTGSPHLALNIAGNLQQTSAGVDTTIVDAYVPAGAPVIHVADGSSLHPGDLLLIRKPVTGAWIHFMGMDNLLRPGRQEHWIGADHLDVRRRIASISGNAIRLEVPLMDSYDAKFFDGTHPEVRKINLTGQIAYVGVEDLRIVAPRRSIAFGDPAFDGLAMQDTVDSWVQSVTMEETTNGFHIDKGSERITVLKCDVVQHVPVTSPALPCDFCTNGSQILFDRCTGSGDHTIYFATEARQQGPVVVLHCRFQGDAFIQPHQRWSTGLLVDNCEVPDGSIDFMNRGEMGTGHGWTIGWAVAWNNTARVFGMNQPPGSAIWSIGNRGQEIDPPFPAFDGSARPPLDPAIIESKDKPVQPQSLYLEQLKERLGATALHNIGYSGAAL
jgi:hypothetical protein